jgi:hypothetical protein
MTTEQGHHCIAQKRCCCIKREGKLAKYAKEQLTTWGGEGGEEGKEKEKRQIAFLLVYESFATGVRKQKFS